MSVISASKGKAQGGGGMAIRAASASAISINAWLSLALLPPSPFSPSAPRPRPICLPARPLQHRHSPRIHMRAILPLLHQDSPLICYRPRVPCARCPDLISSSTLLYTTSPLQGPTTARVTAISSSASLPSPQHHPLPSS
jgi:hypothetical protein